MATDLVLHKGGCHCKRVRFSVRAPANVVVWDCNCSNCAMRRNINFIIPRSNFELDPASEEFLTLYTFGTHTAKHLFCKVCGITSYYIPRSNSDGIAVTLNCIDPGTITHVEKRTYDGKNWESSYSQSEISSFSKIELNSTNPEKDHKNEREIDQPKYEELLESVNYHLSPH